MRVDFGGENLRFFLASSLQWLERLLTEHGPLAAVIIKASPRSVFLRVNHKEVELPLEELTSEQEEMLVPGTSVEVSWQAPAGVSVKVLPRPALIGQDQVTLGSDLDQALLDLDIQPDPETRAVAEALLENGLPLQEQLISTLLPAAETGRLEGAFFLLGAGFPVTSELLDAVEELGRSDFSAPLMAQVEPELTTEEKELLREVQWSSRAQLGQKIATNSVVKSLASLFAQERLLESLLNQQDLSGQFVFAIPFLLDQDLYTGWVRISSEEEQIPSGAIEKTGHFSIQLIIPTETMGVIGGKLKVRGNQVELVFFSAEERSLGMLEESLGLLHRELVEAGWLPTRLQTREGPVLPPQRWVG